MDPGPRTWTPDELASVIDHTLLFPDATRGAIDRLCDEALRHRFAAVCVHGVHVARCAGRLAGSGIAVCSVVAFPLGACAPQVKAFEARAALEDGARELDMVLDIGALRSGDDELVTREIALVVEAARERGALVKVILETALLSHAEKIHACRLAENAGADYVKTSTGFGPGGATVEDVALLRSCVAPRMGVKAAGGVRTARLARALLAAGATRIGSSASVALISS